MVPPKPRQNIFYLNLDLFAQDSLGIDVLAHRVGNLPRPAATVRKTSPPHHARKRKLPKYLNLIKNNALRKLIISYRQNTESYRHN